MKRMSAEKKSKQPGVYYNNTGQAWTANIYVDKKQVFLGNFKSDADAIALRKEAERHKADKTFYQWLKKIRDDRNAYSGVHYKPKGDKYFPKISVDNKAYHLGYYPDREAAARVRKTAEKKKKEGTFYAWYHAVIKNRDKVEGGTTVTNIKRIVRKEVKSNNKSGHTGVFQVGKNKKWKAEMYIMHKKYTASGFDTMQEAVIARERFEHRFLIGFYSKFKDSTDPVYTELLEEIRNYFRKRQIDLEKAVKEASYDLSAMQ